MSVLLVVLIIAITTTHCQENKANTSVQRFQDYVTTIIKEQSSKLQHLLTKIQLNAQSVLEKIEKMKQGKKDEQKHFYLDNGKDRDKINKQGRRRIESSLDMDGTKEVAESRSFNNHYATSSYGASAYGNYGVPTYHHHSIGFDPINIVVSMSLLSFLLQALQGLISRTRLPTPVVEARNLNLDQSWANKYEDLKKDIYFSKRKYPKKYDYSKW